jgi:ABC-type multidrug transport system fused ATPase/permease subunit
MLRTLRRSISFMTVKERASFFSFIVARTFIGVFDLIGILAIGFLATSVAFFITFGSDSNRVIEFAGFTLPAVNAGSLPWVASSILLIFTLKAMASIIFTNLTAKLLARVEARAATVATSAAFGEGLEQSARHSKEEVMFAVQVGAPSAFNAVPNSAATIIAEGFLFALILAAFVIVDPASAFGAIAYFGFIAILMQVILGKLLAESAVSNSQGILDANGAIGDLSSVFREALVMGKKDLFLNRIHNARAKAALSLANQFVLNGLPRYIVETALIFAVSIFVVVQASQGDLVASAGTVGLFLSGGLRLTASLLPLQNALLVVKQAVPQAEKALELIDEQPEVSLGFFKSKVEIDLSINPVGVELKNVHYNYPNSTLQALTDINLVIKPGQQVALIGPSGSGKSTIADLILGLLNPTSGESRIGGENPKEILMSHPGALGYVPQNPGMISGTLLENIALGVAKEDVDEVRLYQSINAANLDNLTQSLPEGLSSDLGKRKDELSGGELQRIGLARALYNQPKLLVMDEATSALDADAENEINKALDAMRGEVTVVLIAHRLNTVQRSDLVFLVEDGRITATGTFPELVKSNKTVQKLADLMAIESAD